MWRYRYPLYKSYIEEQFKYTNYNFKFFYLILSFFVGLGLEIVPMDVVTFVYNIK